MAPKLSGAAFKKIREKKKETNLSLSKNLKSWLTKKDLSLDLDNSISSTSAYNYSNVPELEVGQVQLNSDHSHILEKDQSTLFEQIGKGNLSSETIEAANKTCEQKVLNFPLEQYKDSVTLQSSTEISEIVSQPTLISPQRIDIKMSENFDYGDPATWPLINDSFRSFIIEHGPKLG